MRYLLSLMLASTVFAADVKLPTMSERLGLALKKSEHAEALGLLERLPAVYAKAEGAERKKVVRAIGKAASSRHVPVRHGAFAALAKIRAKGSSKYLRRWLNPKKKVTASHLEAIRAAGRIADKSTLPTLEKQSQHKHIEVAEDATLALGGYKWLAAAKRKALSFDLIKRLESLAQLNGGRGGRRRSEADARADPVIAEQMKRRKRLVIATMLALQELTTQKFRSLPAWVAWRQTWRRSNPWK